MQRLRRELAGRLREKFGEEYDAYCAAVPRWLDQRSLSALRDVLPR